MSESHGPRRPGLVEGARPRTGAGLVVGVLAAFVAGRGGAARARHCSSRASSRTVRCTGRRSRSSRTSSPTGHRSGTRSPATARCWARRTPSSRSPPSAAWSSPCAGTVRGCRSSSRWRSRARRCCSCWRRSCSTGSGRPSRTWTGRRRRRASRPGTRPRASRSGCGLALGLGAHPSAAIRFACSAGSLAVALPAFVLVQPALPRDALADRRRGVRRLHPALAVPAARRAPAARTGAPRRRRRSGGDVDEHLADGAVLHGLVRGGGLARAGRRAAAGRPRRRPGPRRRGRRRSRPRPRAPWPAPARCRRARTASGRWRSSASAPGRSPRRRRRRRTSRRRRAARRPARRSRR